MPYEQKDGDIAIFAETDKKNERAPDWKGTAVIDGVTYEVALWAKGNRGTMLAGQIKPKQERRQSDTDRFRGGGSSGMAGDGRDGAFDPDSEIPF